MPPYILEPPVESNLEFMINNAAIFPLQFILVVLKVRQFQNEFMKSSFLSRYEQKIVRISTLACVVRQKSWQFFVCILGEAMTS